MQREQLRPGSEIVYTVTNYYDGPREGIADYKSIPHFYECIIDSANDHYSDLYRLTPIDELTFSLGMESWAIWKRWERAFHEGKTSGESHPALPEDAARYRELKEILNKTLRSDSDAIIQNGEFSVLGHTEVPRGVIRPLQVRWANP
jgi:hypothetical protein